MKYENVDSLRKELIGKRITIVEVNVAHGMVLTIALQDINRETTTLDIATYDDGVPHDVDDFYVALNGQEL